MNAQIDQLLPVASIRLDVEAVDWKDAIRLAGEALQDGGFTTAAYIDEMIAAVEKLGPYIVIAPGLAIAHSRPSPAVLKTGLSWVRLRSGVNFGNATNDPVTLVIGLAGHDEKEHVEVLSAIAKAFSNKEKTAALAAAQTPQDIREILAAAAG